jgi:hypothetical protein
VQPCELERKRPPWERSMAGTSETVKIAGRAGGAFLMRLRMRHKSYHCDSRDLYSLGYFGYSNLPRKGVAKAALTARIGRA